MWSKVSRSYFILKFIKRYNLNIHSVNPIWIPNTRGLTFLNATEMFLVFNLIYVNSKREWSMYINEGKDECALLVRRDASARVIYVRSGSAWISYKFRRSKRSSAYRTRASRALEILAAADRANGTMALAVGRFTAINHTARRTDKRAPTKGLPP